jgi:hypothetical protein
MIQKTWLKMENNKTYWMETGNMEENRDYKEW